MKHLPHPPASDDPPRGRLVQGRDAPDPSRREAKSHEVALEKRPIYPVICLLEVEEQDCQVLPAVLRPLCHLRESEGVVQDTAIQNEVCLHIMNRIQPFLAQ